MFVNGIETQNMSVEAGKGNLSVLNELCDDVAFKNSVNEFDTRIETLGKIVQSFCEGGMYTNLSIEEKVKYDLFLSYTLSSLYWAYLRTQGEDPTGHIKSELDRVKQYMDKSKQINDRKSMPRLDRDAAKRFVRSGLWDPNSKADSAGTSSRKRKRFDNDDD